MPTIDASVIQFAKQQKLLPIVPYQALSGSTVSEWISERAQVELTPDVYITLGDLVADKELANEFFYERSVELNFPRISGHKQT